MDPLNIHHVIRHRLSRIETNNFQDKSGCSINGFRSFLFDEGIVQSLDDLEGLISYSTIQDFRGYPIQFRIRNFNNFPLSDEILKMKNVRFYFYGEESKPIHKLVSPEPHFVEEERNLIENHFKYLVSSCEVDDIEEWSFFRMDCEGHLVSLEPCYFQGSNETIEHLSNFPHLRNLVYGLSSFNISGSVTNFSLLTHLKRLTVKLGREFDDPELLKDLGLFTNLHSLSLRKAILSCLK